MDIRWWWWFKRKCERVMLTSTLKALVNNQFYEKFDTTFMRNEKSCQNIKGVFDRVIWELLFVVFWNTCGWKSVWYRFESVRWMLWLRWATERWKAYKKQTLSKRGPKKTGQTPSDGEVSFTGMKFQLFGSQILECS